MLWVFVICGLASVAMRYLEPTFPKKRYTRLQAWTLLPLIALILGAKFLLVEPTQQQVVLVGCRIVVVAAFIFQAYEDKKVWTSGVDVVA
jgi:hypothetical protein